MRLIQYLDDDGNQRVGCTSTDAAGAPPRRHRSSCRAGPGRLRPRRARWTQMAEPRLGALEADAAGALLDGLRVLTPADARRPGALPGQRHRPHPPGQRRRRATPCTRSSAAQAKSRCPTRCACSSGASTAAARAAAQAGVQPEWFYKGDGQHRRRARRAARHRPTSRSTAAKSPSWSACTGSRRTARRCRLGFAVGNEFSDHVTERQNYLYLAHSKLRACAVGPELRSRRAAGRPAGHQPHPPRRAGGVGEALRHRRGQHEPHARQPGVPPLQVRRSTAGRATCTCTSSAPPR